MLKRSLLQKSFGGELFSYEPGITALGKVFVLWYRADDAALVAGTLSRISGDTAAAQEKQAKGG